MKREATPASPELGFYLLFCRGSFTHRQYRIEDALRWVRTPMRTVIEPQTDHLHVVVSGVFNPKQLANSLKNIFTASSRHGLYKILIDIRAIEGEITFIARYEAGKVVADLQREKVQLVILGTQNQLWPDRFFENFANKQGVATKVTLEMAEALEWLSRTPADASSESKIK